MNASRYRWLAVVGVGLALIATTSACGSGPGPTLAEVYTATATAPPAGATAVATTAALEQTTRAPAASATQVAPSDTPRPSRTPRPTATRRPTSSPTPTEPPEGPEFPPDVNPLTGLEVEDTELLERCPLAVKVSNAPEVVRPQAGLDQADLVFEHYAEGGVTRLTAVFLGQTPKMVGSVRSGRLIDLEIPAMYKALFAYSGTSAGVGQRYAGSDLWPDQLARPGTASGAFYRRDLAKAFEHTLFVDPTALWEEAERRDISGRQELRGMSFAADPPAGGSSADALRIDYRAGISKVEWRYDEQDERYYRWQGGVAHREELSGAQLSAANVIVVSANHVETDIVEDTWGGGHWSIEVQIWGEGPVSVFRDGQRYDGIWRRQDRHDMLSFWTQDGSKRIPLKPGNSWLQMVPLGFTGLEITP
jgi:hypothetical protein